MTAENSSKSARRIPTQSVTSDDESTTKSLRLLFCLVEIERQATIYNESLSDAIAASVGHLNEDAVWRHIQSSMFAAIIINRFVTDDEAPPAWPWVNPRSEGRRLALAAAKWRSSELRRLLNLPDDPASTPIFHVRSVRNSLEHIDARIDRAFNSAGVSSLSDWYLSDGTFLTSPENTPEGQHPAGLRGFDPNTGLLMFDKEPLNLFHLDIDILKVKHNAREAQAEIMKEIAGGNLFGNAQVSRFRSHDDTKYIEKWRNQRRRIEASMHEPVHLDARVKLWAQVGDSPSDR